MQLLTTAHEAFTSHDWIAALSVFKQANLAAALSAEDNEKMALAAWWVSDIKLCIDLREKAYAQYISQDRLTDAGRMCLLLAENYYYENVKAVSTRWYRQGKAHLEMQRDSADYGWLLRYDGYHLFETDGPEVALTFAEEALELALKHGDRDLEYLCRQDIGRYSIALGQVKEGLEMMENTMVHAMSGSADPMTSGKLLCNMIEICDELVDYQRAIEWDSVARNWCNRVGQHSGFPGVCRVKRAGLMRRQGAWEEAEREALKAKQELVHFTPFASRAIYEVGEIRLRLGDLEKAEQAFREAHTLGLNPQPGLALLYDAQGKTQAGFELLQSTLTEIKMPLLRIPVVTALGQLAIKLNKHNIAEQAFHEIEKTGTEYESPAMLASATTLKGQIAMIREDYQSAIESFKSAQSYWLTTGLPYETAVARMHVGLVYNKLGRSEQGRLELESALREFERLGAKPDIDRVQKVLLRSQNQTQGAVRKAMMFTDIVGSTALIGLIGDSAWKHLVQWHDRTLRSLFESHQGSEVDHAGDGFFVSFENSSEAVSCAQEIQRTLMRHRSTQGFAPNVRIGIHCAEVSHSGSTLVGLEVHKAARIASLADAGEIIASFEMSCDIDASQLGERKSVSVKGIAEPVDVVMVEWKE